LTPRANKDGEALNFSFMHMPGNVVKDYLKSNRVLAKFILIIYCNLTFEFLTYLLLFIPLEGNKNDIGIAFFTGLLISDVITIFLDAKLDSN